VKGQKVGFIGLGNMGRHMASNLVNKGHEVMVYDLSHGAVQSLVDIGATGASTTQEVAQQADVLITMLPSSPHVQEVFAGPEGIAPLIKEGALVIDSSTIDPTTSRQVAQVVEKQTGVQMVDAPVSGGVGGAEQGTLTFMVGGLDEAFARAQPILADMGKNIVHCGDIGTGQVAKVCNNLVLGISMVGVSEAMALGIKAGMDPKKLAGIFNTSSARCWSSDTYNPCPGVMEGVPASRGYTGGFGVDLMKKDLGLALMSGDDVKAALPMGNLAHQVYSDISAAGGGGKDFSYAFEHLKNVE